MRNKFLLPPNLFYASILLIIVLYFVFRQFNLVKFPYNTVGFVLVAIGVGLNIIAWQQFVKAKTPEKFEKSKKLVVDGLYKYSRNPMYVGAILILIGLVLLLGNVLAFVSPILFFLAINNIVIVIEEKKTAVELGENYLEYKRKVRKWI